MSESRPGQPIRVPFGIPAIALVLLAGLLFRLFLTYVLLPGEGFRDDLRMFEDWARVLADHGPAGFYQNALPPDTSPGYLYTPGYLYALWLVGGLARGIATVTGADQGEVIAGLIKVPAIIADLLVAFVLYRAGTRWWGSRAGLVSAALFLFLPVGWYDSVIWGQVDAVGSLILLAALLLLIGGWSEFAVAAAVLALVVKPQYAVGIMVIGAVLIGRHLLRPGSGPVPELGRRWRAIDGRLGGWFTAQQGARRLVSSAVVGAAVFAIAILPFDIERIANARFADLPLVGQVIGFVTLVRSSGGYYPHLTVNAFNIWTPVGPDPLASSIGLGDTMTPDSLHVLGPLPAVILGAALFGIAALAILVTLAVRDDRDLILIGFTALALAFFILPTRVHERYLFPAIVTGALLAGPFVAWRWWVVILGVAHAINLHVLITLPLYGTPGIQGLPLGDFLRAPSIVLSVAVVQVSLFAWAMWRFATAGLAQGLRSVRRAPPPTAG